MQKKILIVDDEQNIVDILKFNLEKEGYETIEAYDGQTAVDLALSESPDLILLDVMLPIMDGFDVCKKIRMKKSTPILMLTAKEEEIDKVLGLELGADDYITKPFSTREIIARVKANLRRISNDRDNREEDLMEFESLVINSTKYEVYRDGEVIDLTLREFELLRYLAADPGKIFSRENLLENVWGYDYYGDIRTVDVTIRRLREKIEKDTDCFQYILTKRGMGYYFSSNIKRVN